MWRLYYTDGSTVTGETRDEWAHAPGRGVAGLLTPSERVGRFVETGNYYFWPPWHRLPLSGDAWGVMDYLLHVGGMEPEQSLESVSYAVLEAYRVKLGRSMTDEDWQRLYREMVADPDFPRKSGREAGERAT